MLAVLVAIRNFTVAVLLAWMGFSVSPDNDDKQDSVAPVPNSAAFNVFTG